MHPNGPAGAFVDYRQHSAAFPRSSLLPNGIRFGFFIVVAVLFLPAFIFSMFFSQLFLTLAVFPARALFPTPCSARGQSLRRGCFVRQPRQLLAVGCREFHLIAAGFFGFVESAIRGPQQ